MKELIEAAAREAKISQIGFARAEVFSDLGAVLAESDEVPMAEQDIEKRINPFLIMEDAKTVIVLAFSYYTKTKGNISMYARGRDYHKVTKKLAYPILSLLRDRGYKAEFFCDNAKLDERYLERSAGIGFIGKNGFLISPKFGSFVFLAHIVTDCEMEPDKPNTGSCEECGRCIKECPSESLKTGDYYSCLSYITQKKGELSEKEKELIRKTGTCWGCDICQLVCPHNKDAEQTGISEFCEDLICSIEKISGSNREFKRKFSDRAFSWRGKGVIERNLNIINNI